MAKKKRQRQKQSAQARAAYLRAQRQKEQRRRKALAGVALFLVLGMVVALFATTGGRREEARTAERPDCSPVAGKSTFPAPPPDTIDKAKNYRAAIETDVGTFTVELDDERAPKTVNNFVFLARNQFYDCVPFHRVIPGFVVQGGDGEKGDGTGGPGYTIPDELPESGPYAEGAVAMANTGQPNSGGSQFFVVTGPEGMGLQPQYSLFGRVVEGLDVVKKIEADGSPDGQSLKAVHKMLKVTVTEA